LRTRLSKKLLNLGMNVMVMNFTNEGWSLEFENGAIMNQALLNTSKKPPKWYNIVILLL
jgi:hypothetical protein